MFIGVIVASHDRQFLHIETGLLEFLDSSFGSRVRWINCYDGIVFVHTFCFVAVILVRITFEGCAEMSLEQVSIITRRNPAHHDRRREETASRSRPITDPANTSRVTGV
jgi:hypothetical protein